MSNKVVVYGPGGRFIGRGVETVPGTIVFERTKLDRGDLLFIREAVQEYAARLRGDASALLKRIDYQIEAIGSKQ